MKGKAPAKKNRYVTFFQPKETWTHNFCLLGCVSDDISPSKDEIVHLQNAGLGKRKIVFPNKNADHANECKKMISLSKFFASGGKICEWKTGLILLGAFTTLYTEY